MRTLPPATVHLAENDGDDFVMVPLSERDIMMLGRMIRSVSGYETISRQAATTLSIILDARNKLMSERHREDAARIMRSRLKAESEESLERRSARHIALAEMTKKALQEETDSEPRYHALPDGSHD
jgi:hypothetical protein